MAKDQPTKYTGLSIGGQKAQGGVVAGSRTGFPPKNIKDQSRARVDTGRRRTSIATSTIPYVPVICVVAHSLVLYGRSGLESRESEPPRKAGREKER
jgi:hypothetical protein